MAPACRSKRRAAAASTSLGAARDLEAAVQQRSTIDSVTGGSAAGMMRDWTKLFPELVVVVANVLLLTDVKDYISMRAACKAWRGATTNPRILDPRFFPRNWILIQTKIKLGSKMGSYLLSTAPSSPTRRATLSWPTRAPRLFLFNPMTAATADLPYLNVRRKSERSTMDLTPEVTAAGIIYGGDGDGVTVVLCCLTQQRDAAILCAKPSDTAWVKVDARCMKHEQRGAVPMFRGGLSMGGNFYVPTRAGNVLKVELSPAPHLVHVARQDKLDEDCFGWCDFGMCLVPSLDIDDTNDGMLLLVNGLYDSERPTICTFCVFGVKLAEGRLTRMHDIGNRTILLRFSATLRTDKFPSLAKSRRILSENARIDISRL
uniref:F-box domain protein n=1 Tax=Brachypodium distachyon TaxID=15368 RepID=C3SA46_BRADI|nr:F-box domain protein [Brachypodium distachyon]